MSGDCALDLPHAAGFIVYGLGRVVASLHRSLGLFWQPRRP